MTKGRFKPYFISSASMLVMAAAPAFGQSMPAPAADKVGVTDIVVTAQKREQSLQDVPVAVTAINQNAIQANRIQDVTDLSSIAPNLTVSQGLGGSKIPQYSMRGLFTFGSTAGTDKGVSLYIDGVYIQAVGGSIFELADVTRIEVLRGPQGTLFGRNSTGGAVSIITRDATGEFGMRQELTYGNLGQLRSKTRIDLPKVGPLSLTASYLHSERKGDIRNLGAGTQWNFGPATNGRLRVLTSPNRLGNENVEGIFVAAGLDLHPDVDITYKFDYSENDYSPTGTGLNYLPGGAAASFGGIDPATAFAFQTVLDRYLEQDPANRTPITSKRPRAVNNWYTLPATTKNLGHNLTMTWQASDTVSVKNILAYRKSSLLTPGFQLDGLGGLFGDAFAGPFAAPDSYPGSVKAPIHIITTSSEKDESQWSNELQINVDTDPLTLTVGGIYFDHKIKQGAIDGLYNVMQFGPVAGTGTPLFPTPFVVQPNPGYQRALVKSKSIAVYAQPEYHVTDRLDLVAGIRYTKDRKRGTEYIPGTYFPYAPSLGRNTQNSYKDSQVTWLLGVNYRPTDDILTYAKYSTGYISGGQIATVEFKPEKARSLEAGIKADLFNGILRTNLALFSVKYDAIQATVLGTATGIPSAAGFSSAVISMADAKAKGFELETTLVPIRNLTLQANVGYTDFKFDDDTVYPSIVFTSGAPGLQEYHRPKWTGNLSAQYETDEVFAGGHLMFRADANYIGKWQGTQDFSPGVGPDAQADPAIIAAGLAKAAWTVNGRIALQNMDVGGVTATLALWGKNIFNDRGINQTGLLSFANSLTYNQARLYGIDLSFEF